jgi:hypothetical protein
MHRANPFLEIVTYNDLATLIVILFFSLSGVAYWLSKIVDMYKRSLWKGMDAEERFELVKIPKWPLLDPNRKDFILVEKIDAKD